MVRSLCHNHALYHFVLFLISAEGAHKVWLNKHEVPSTFKRVITPPLPGVDASIVRSSAQVNENSDQLTSISAVYYIGPVTVGNQTFQTIYDTGSNLLWIPGPACGATCRGHELYSGLYASTNERFSIQYGSGSAEGSLVYAPVTLADASLSSFKIGLLSDNTFTDFPNSPYDGLVGLAWPALSAEDGVVSLIPAMHAAGEIQANMFAIYLAPNGTGGELTLGEMDESKYFGNMTWLPLVQESWWTVNLESVLVGGGNATSTSGNSQTLIIDSGTSLIIGPNSQIIDLIDQIQSISGVPVRFDSNSQIYSVSCSQVASLPSVSFVLSGSDDKKSSFTLPSNMYILEALSWDPSICPLTFQGSGNGAGMSPWILGVPFLRVFYSVYDYENSRVGLAASYPGTGFVTPHSSSGTPSSYGLASIAALLVICLLF